MSNTKWALDLTHSEIQFKIKHMMISTVSGNFKKFDGTVETDGDDFSTANINFNVDLSSISTNNEQRDGHLRSSDFFDEANHPMINITATGMERTGDDTFNIPTHVTMHGVTIPVTFKAEHGGIIKDPYGLTRTGFTIEGKINRSDFGMNFNIAMEAGGLALGNEVKLHGGFEFTKQA